MTKLSATTRGRRTATSLADDTKPPAGATAACLADVLQATGSRCIEFDTGDMHRWVQDSSMAGPELILCQPDNESGAPVTRVSPGATAGVASFLAKLPRTNLPATFDFHAGDARETRWTRIVVLRSTGRGKTKRFFAVLSDITALKRLEADILQINERVQNRIGQELHDDLCQVLAGLSCLTRVLENRIAPRLPEEVDNLREINTQLVDAMDRTRALTHGLYPARMRSGDARAALLELAKEVEVRFGVKVSTSFRGRFPAHDAQEILQVYRIAQEAISNAIRHGRASGIDLALECGGDSMHLRVQDNGSGFPKTAAAQPGIGLQIMQHRAAQIGGRITVGNAPRRGAFVALHYHPVTRV